MLKCKFGLLIQIYKWKIVEICCRSPRGNVDWNWRAVDFILSQIGRSPRGNVDWNSFTSGLFLGLKRRSPRGNVDWNLKPYLCYKYIIPSFPTRERGLKLLMHWPERYRRMVVPHAGTWIEIIFPISFAPVFLVVPHAGTWIEI